MAVTEKLQLQRRALRNPDLGLANLAEVVELDYVFNSTGAALTLVLPATVANPIILFAVMHAVRTAFAGGTPSIDIGDGTDVDGYLDSTDITETTAGNFANSMTAASADAVLNEGEYLTAPRSITVTLSASLTAGAGKVLALIYRL